MLRVTRRTRRLHRKHIDRKLSRRLAESKRRYERYCAEVERIAMLRQLPMRMKSGEYETFRRAEDCLY